MVSRSNHPQHSIAFRLDDMIRLTIGLGPAASIAGLYCARLPPHRTGRQ
jgi:hypothetical protein